MNAVTQGSVKSAVKAFFHHLQAQVITLLFFHHHGYGHFPVSAAGGIAAV